MKPLELSIATALRGAGGGAASTPRSPIESPDSLRSIAYARILDLIGEGEIYGFSNQEKPLTCVFLNETPVANDDGSLNFKNIQIDSRVGTQVQDYIQGFDGVENEIAVNVELRDDVAWTRSINNLNLNALRVRMAVPALSRAETTGDITGARVGYTIELQTDGGSFVSKLVGAFSGKTTTKYERSHRIDLPPATSGWVIRVTRTTPNAGSAATQDTTLIESYTEIIDAKLRMPMSALVSVIVDAEQFNNIPSRAYLCKGRIIQVPSNYDPDTRTYTGLWDGTFQPRYSNNPAWVFYDMALNTRYGLGHLVTADQVDKWSLYRIAQYCDEMVGDGYGGQEPRFTCNIVFQTQNDALRVMQDLATVFRGIIYATGGSITGVSDMPEDAVYPYTPSNVIGGKFVYSGSSAKVRHTVALVSWSDMSDFGRAKVEYVEDPQGIARYGIQQTEIIAAGCSSRGQARRFGTYLLTTERYETDTVVFSVGMDGTVAAPGKIVTIADPMRAGVRMGGRISSASLRVVVVDSLPTVSVGDTLIVTLPTATIEKRTIGFVNPATRQIGVTTNFSALPAAQSVWSVETDELAVQTFRVLAVTEMNGDSLGYTISAVQHVPGKFAYVDSGVMIEEPPIAQIPPPLVPSPTGLLISTREVVEQNSVAKVVNLSWNLVAVAVSYQVQWRLENGSWTDLGKVTTVNTDIYGVGTGAFEVQVIAFDVLGRRSLPTFGGPYSILPIQSPPGYVDDMDHTLTVIQGQMDDLGAQTTQLRTDVDQAIDDIQQEVTDRATAISDEANARATAILNEQNTRAAAITAEQTIRQSADDSLATQISLVSAGSGEQFDSAKIWYFDADLESWTGNGSPTLVDGWLRPANHATDPYIASPTGLAIAGQSYRFAKMRIKKTGTPAWSGEIRWRLAGDTAGVWRGPMAIPEPAFDANGVTAIAWQDIAWWPGTIDQVRLDISTSQTATSYYVVDWIAVGRPTPGAGVALVQDETAARVQADSAEATQRTTLATQMRGAYTGSDVAGVTTGLIYSERQARSTADTAMASDITALQASVGTNTANISTEQTTRANADSALSTRIDSVTATANNAATQASLTAEQSARANADTAMATDISLLGASNAGKTAFNLNSSTVKIDGTQTLAQTLTGLQATDAGTNARVDTEQAARIAGDSANATAITAVSARLENSSANLIVNPTGASGFSGWAGFIGGSQQSMTTAVESIGPVFTCTMTGTGSDQGASQNIMGLQGVNYTLSGEIYAGHMLTGSIYVEVRFLNSSGVEITSTNRPRITATNGVTTGYQKLVVANVAPPAGTAGASVVIRSTGTGNGLCRWKRLKLEANTVDSPFSDDATSAQAISTLVANVGPGGAYARAMTMLDVNGRISGVSQNNNGTTSDFIILADKFGIVSPAGGARTEYSAGSWKVYDAAGVLRVQMGVW